MATCCGIELPSSIKSTHHRERRACSLPTCEDVRANCCQSPPELRAPWWNLIRPRPRPPGPKPPGPKPPGPKPPGPRPRPTRIPPTRKPPKPDFDDDDDDRR